MTPKFPRDKKFMLLTDLMTSLFRLLLIGIAFFTASHLAVRGAVGAELELGGVSTVEPPVAEDPASPQVDSDLWADSFLPTPGRPAAVRIEPVQRPAAAHRGRDCACYVAGGYTKARGAFSPRRRSFIFATPTVG